MRWLQDWLFIRVTRWFIFKPKIAISVNFGDPYIGKCWYTLCKALWNILRTFEILNDHLVGTFCVHLVYFSGFLVSCTKKNLANLLHMSFSHCPPGGAVQWRDAFKEHTDSQLRKLPRFQGPYSETRGEFFKRIFAPTAKLATTEKFEPTEKSSCLQKKVHAYRKKFTPTEKVHAYRKKFTPTEKSSRLDFLKKTRL
jgi:hypothetical protein